MRQHFINEPAILKKPVNGVSTPMSHRLTFIGLFIFTFIVYFRPHEFFPSNSILQSSAFFAAVGTILIFAATQILAPESLSAITTEVKCLLFMSLWAFITIPISRDTALAWEAFRDNFSKVAIIFVILVVTLRSSTRIKSLMWLAIGSGVILSIEAINLYRAGQFDVEGYRVNVDFGGMFGNPNDLAIHFVIFIPIAISLGIAHRGLVRYIYIASAGLMVMATTVTQSRGGFLGLMIVSAVLVWKLGKSNRLKSILISSLVAVVFFAVIPGDYGTRVLSIFDSSLDSVGSSNQRWDSLERSLFVTLRNPLGVGIGNSRVMDAHNKETHNAYTQISSELGWLPFVAYLIFLISPLRKLLKIERKMHSDRKHTWEYYAMIGVQAGILGYMTSSFFASVAYQWYVYYPVAFAIGLRRIYQSENPSIEEKAADMPPDHSRRLSK